MAERAGAGFFAGGREGGGEGVLVLLLLALLLLVVARGLPVAHATGMPLISSSVF